VNGTTSQPINVNNSNRQFHVQFSSFLYNESLVYLRKSLNNTKSIIPFAIERKVYFSGSYELYKTSLIKFSLRLKYAKPNLNLWNYNNAFEPRSLVGINEKLHFVTSEEKSTLKDISQFPTLDNLQKLLTLCNEKNNICPKISTNFTKPTHCFPLIFPEKFRRATSLAWEAPGCRHPCACSSGNLTAPYLGRSLGHRRYRAAL